MKRRRYIALLAAAALAACALAGCGNSKTTAEKSSAPESKTEESSVSATETADGEDVTVTVLHNLNEESALNWLDQVVAQFETENPNIKVDMEVLSSDDYNSMLRNKIASDDVPDIFFINDIVKLKEFIDAGLCEDISGQTWLAENIQEDSIKACTNADGTVSVVPQFISGMYVTYNKDVFDKAGITEVPKTWSAFIEDCKKIVDSGVPAIACGYQDAWTLYSDEQCDSIVTTLTYDPTNRLDLEAGTTTFAEDKGHFSEVLSRLQERCKYANDDPFGTDWNTAQNMLATGEAGMIINGSWTPAGIKSINPDANIGIFPLPLTENPEDAKLPLHTSPGGFAAYKDSANKEAALKFLAFLSTPESGKLEQDIKGDISACKNVQVAEDSLLYEVTQYINNGEVFDWSGYTEMFVSDELQSIMTNVETELISDQNMTVEEAIEQLDEQFAAAISAKK